jgi:hypothetical protein
MIFVYATKSSLLLFPFLGSLNFVSRIQLMREKAEEARLLAERLQKLEEEKNEMAATLSAARDEKVYGFCEKEPLFCFLSSTAGPAGRRGRGKDVARGQRVAPGVAKSDLGA